MQATGEGFAQNHDAVHAERKSHLARAQLYSQNPSRAAVQEQRRFNNHTRGLEHFWQSQDASPQGELLFYNNQAWFTQMLQMLDSDPVSLGNLQVLMLGLMQEEPATLSFRTLAIIEPERRAGK